MRSLSAAAARLVNAPNFRDLGGHRARDGRSVRTGVLYRSDQLHRLDEAECATIGALGIELVVDLRQAAERRRAPNPALAGARELVADVLADSGRDAEGVTPEGWVLIAAGRGAEFMHELYRDLVAKPAAQRAYAALIRAVVDARGAALIHCAAGQDRTGWAAAVLLRILDVDRDTVMQDYLLSARRLDAKHQRLLQSYARRYAHQGIGEVELRPLLWIRAEYLERAFAEVDRLFGSFDTYLDQALGVDEPMRVALRHRLLTSDG